jgi:hypothetical protein
MDFFGEGFAFLIAFAIVLPLGLLALVVLVLAGGRDIDPTGRRTFALYVAVVSFVAVFTALTASTQVVNSLTEKIRDEDASEDFEDFEDFDTEDLEDFEDFGDSGSDVTQNDRVIRGAVQAGLVLAVSIGVLVFHTRRRREYMAHPEFAGSAAWRTDRAYLYAVCFTAILVFLFATGFGSYEIFQVFAPGVFASGDDSVARKDGLQALLTLGWLALASVAIFRYHWRQAHPRAAPATPPPAPPPVTTP